MLERVQANLSQTEPHPTQNDTTLPDKYLDSPVDFPTEELHFGTLTTDQSQVKY
jgi:hypothetical protein